MFIDKDTGLETEDPSDAVYVGTQKEYIHFVLDNFRDEYMMSDVFEMEVQRTKLRIPDVG
jgi:hypothetical protein